MVQSLSWKCTSSSAGQKMACFNATRGLITVFTKAPPLGPHPEQGGIRATTSHHISLISISALSSNLRLDPPSGLFSWDLTIKILYEPFMSHPYYHHLSFTRALQSSWTHLITPSRNFMEVGWRSLFRSTSLGKRCTSYNAPPTLRKRAADRWSLRNFLPQSPSSWFEKPRNRVGRDLDCMADVLMRFYRSTFSKPNTEFNSDHATTTLPPPLQLRITVTASLCITAAHCSQSTNFSNGPRSVCNIYIIFL
jgi:hypothetical protein